MNIHLYNRQKDLKLPLRQVRKAILSLVEFLEIKTDEISFYFVSEPAIAKLHGEFFDDPTPTDCITFPIDQSFLGEVFVCPKVALEYAKKHKLDPLEETFLYIVHGMLHLIGFDDLDPKSKQAMRKKEKSCMRHIKEHIL